MATLEELHEVKSVVNAQQNIIALIKSRLDEVSKPLSKVEQQKSEISELDALLSELESNTGNLDFSDIEDWDEAEITKIYENAVKKNYEEIQTLNYSNWKQFVKESVIYCSKNNLDITLPYESFLTNSDLDKLKKESYSNLYKWDKLDYMFVGTAGILASLADYFLVKIPKTIEYAGKVQEGSPITEFLKNHINSEKEGSWFANFAKKMEENCKVPYDVVNGGLEGMSGKTHRLQSFGHDPVLGFIFGVIDIMKGTLTGFSYNKLSNTHTLTSKLISENQSVGLIEAVLMQIGHLISDVGTKSGIQPPFFTLFQGINFESPFSPKNKTIGEIARWMYLNGYDFRHFLTMGITPAIIELILRAYLMIRHYKENKEVKFNLASNPKYRSMLLSAHAIACAGNVGKVALMQGNPLAINYAEWLAMLRYLLPSLKYWIFDKQKLELQHLQSINEKGWAELIDNNNDILEKVYLKQLNPISIG